MLWSSSVAFGILRFIATVAIVHPHPLFAPGSTLGVHNADSLGEISALIFLAMVEEGVALIAICLPTLHPGTLFNHTLWARLSQIGSSWISHRNSSSRNLNGRQESLPGSQPRPRHLKGRGSGEHSEADLNATSYQMECRVESQSQRGEERYAEAIRRYEDLFPIEPGKVEAMPREAV